MNSEDIHLRIAELLNTLEEPIDFEMPKDISDIGAPARVIYGRGFRDGEEAHKKKVREVFLGKQNG